MLWLLILLWKVTFRSEGVCRLFLEVAQLSISLAVGNLRLLIGRRKDFNARRIGLDLKMTKELFIQSFPWGQS